MFRFFDQFFNNPSARANRDAQLMAEDAEEALVEVQSGYVGAGYLTSCIVLLHESPEPLHDWAREQRRVIQTLGFGCRIESINALEAWLGTHPGNGFANLRRPLVNTLNLADLLPLASIWSGLLYLFHRIETALAGQPALLILDEAWIRLGYPVFREKVREWLKVMRKANCAVVLATQNLSDAVRSGIMDVLVESCPTKILLPNLTARQDGQRELYTGMGCNARQIEIVATATPKRDYYVMASSGRRLIQLALQCAHA